MSLFGFVMKPKRCMRRVDTNPIKMGRFTFTAHAQNRIVDERRKIKKRDVIAHVYQRPLLETLDHPHVDKKGKVEFVYDRIGKKLTSRIDSFTDNVKTIQVNNVRECKKHGIVIDDSKRRTFDYERNLKPKKH